MSHDHCSLVCVYIMQTYFVVSCAFAILAATSSMFAILPGCVRYTCGIKTGCVATLPATFAVLPAISSMFALLPGYVRYICGNKQAV